MLIEAEPELVTPFDTDPLADATHVGEDDGARDTDPRPLAETEPLSDGGKDPVGFEEKPSPEEVNDPFDTDPLTDADTVEESDRTIDSVGTLETDTEPLTDLDS